MKPKYKVIMDDIKEEILNGSLTAGDKLPTENELSKTYSYSRMTVNKALQLLVSEGLIERDRGRGSYVKIKEIEKTFAQGRSFSEDVRLVDGVPGSICLDYRLIKANTAPEAAKALRVKPEDSLHYIEKIRTYNGKKVAYSKTYLSSKAIEYVSIAALEGSLYEFLKNEFRIEPICCSFTIRSIIADSTISKILGIEQDALLNVAHVSLLETGEPFEYNDTLYLGHYFSYRTNYPPDRAIVKTYQEK